MGVSGVLARMVVCFYLFKVADSIRLLDFIRTSTNAIVGINPLPADGLLSNNPCPCHYFSSFEAGNDKKYTH